MRHMFDIGADGKYVVPVGADDRLFAVEYCAVHWIGAPVMVRDGAPWRLVDSPEPAYRADYVITVGDEWRAVDLAGDCVDRRYRLAWRRAESERGSIDDGPCTLIGPSIMGNPHRVNAYRLAWRGDHIVQAPTGFYELRQFMLDCGLGALEFTTTYGFAVVDVGLFRTGG